MTFIYIGGIIVSRYKNVRQEGKHIIKLEEKINMQEIKTNLLEVADIERTTELISRIEKEENLDPVLRLDLSVQKIRFHLLSGQIHDASLQIEKVNRERGSLSKEQQYYYFKFKGNVHYANQELEEAYKMYLRAIPLIIAIPRSLEVADLYYSLGLTASRLMDHQMAIMYTEEALSIYEDEQVVKRAIECCVGLGHNHSFFKNFKSAMDYFSQAMELLKYESSEEHRLHFVVNYNYAYLLMSFHDYERATDFYRAALDYLTDNDATLKIRSLTGVMRAYIQLDNLVEAHRSLVRAEVIFTQMNPNELLEKQEELIEYRVVRAFLESDYEEYESLVVNEFFPLIRKVGHESDFNYYRNQLSSMYLDHNHFKEAGDCLKIQFIEKRCHQE